jgi:hypothetical protein
MGKDWMVNRYRYRNKENNKDMEHIKKINTFKPKYSLEEIRELVTWFKDRMDKLPETLVLDECSKTDNLQKTVKAFIALLDRDKINPFWSGYISHFLLIRERLREQGIE